MNKAEERKSKLEREELDDKNHEENSVEWLVTFKGSVYVNALDEDEAIVKAQAMEWELVDNIDDWRAE